MALLFRNDDGTYKNTCPICETMLSTPVFATSHFIDDESDPLWRFSDARMHWDCYANWPDRSRFAEMYFDYVTEHQLTNPYWPTVLRHPYVTVRANLDTPMQCLELDLRSIGPAGRVAASDWPSFVRGDKLVECVHGFQRSAIADALPIIRDAIPSIESIRSTIAHQDGG